MSKLQDLQYDASLPEELEQLLQLVHEGAGGQQSLREVHDPAGFEAVVEVRLSDLAQVLLQRLQLGEVRALGYQHSLPHQLQFLEPAVLVEGVGRIQHPNGLYQHQLGHRLPVPARLDLEVTHQLFGLPPDLLQHPLVQLLGHVLLGRVGLPKLAVLGHSQQTTAGLVVFHEGGSRVGGKGSARLFALLEVLQQEVKDVVIVVLVGSSDSFGEVLLVVVVEPRIAVGEQSKELLHLLHRKSVGLLLRESGHQGSRVEVECELAFGELQVQEVLEGGQSEQFTEGLVGIGNRMLVVCLVEVVVKRVAEINEVLPAQLVGLMAGQQVLLQPLLHTSAACSFLPPHFFVPVLAQTVIDPLHYLDQLALPPQHQLAEVDAPLSFEVLLLRLGGEVGQVDYRISFICDAGVEFQCAVDALQDGIVYFVLAGQPRPRGEAVLLLRVAGRARDWLLRWPGSGPVLR